MSTRQIATFRLDDHLLGLFVEDVQEVLRPQRITPVPRTVDAVGGLINLRGQVVTAVDLRAQFGLPARTEGTEAMNVVVRADGEALALLVDSIGDVITVDDADFEEPPGTLTGKALRLIRGAYKLPTGLLLHLDAAAALSVQSDAA